MVNNNAPNYWFVGASAGAVQDMTDELVEAGEWRFWPGKEKPDLYRKKILSMRPGDKIAIKATYFRKNDLPFDNRGYPVSVMAIKAIGEVTENPGDGQSVKVDWLTRYEEPREWYFYTGRSAVWSPRLDRKWYAQALIRFAFEEEDQDIEAFRKEPYWRDRFGTRPATESRLAWTGFFEDFATALLAYENNRKKLVAGLMDLQESEIVPFLGYLREKGSDGSRTSIEDVCPFTFIGIFNRSMTDENRRVIAAALARLIGLERDVPESFDGVPVLNNRKSWFYAWSERRGESDIDNLWEVFRDAINYADAEEGTGSRLRGRLAESYDTALHQRGVAWNLSIGLFWARPWSFVPLDQKTRLVLTRDLGIEFPNMQRYTDFTGEDYLSLVDELEGHFEDGGLSAGTFPELSVVAWEGEPGPSELEDDITNGDGELPADGVPAPYGVKEIIEEGAFFASRDIEKMLDRLEQKKNLILQGAPGTGKTWLARKLAYALIGAYRPDQVTPLQFHPSLSYEDFVRGWRPSSGGTLEIVDGPMMRAIEEAKANPDNRIVVVIEEINRGNPAEIFGEMLTLLEADKRSADHSMRLSHMLEGEPNIFVPRNLFIIGTMNIADRSLALMDLALRRRFSFIGLKPQFNDAWVGWIKHHGGFDDRAAQDLRFRMESLNEVISSDEALGANFCVGHSYVTPRPGADIGRDKRQWFRDVVETEIGPLLEEYWFDREDKAEEEKARLLEGW